MSIATRGPWSLCARCLLPLAVLVALLGPASSAQDLTVVGWNLESGESNLDTLKATISSIEADLWGFSEAFKSWKNELEGAAESAFSGNVDFGSWYGTTGGADRLILCWNKSKVTLKQTPSELHQINDPGKNHRSPLYAEFLHNESGTTFLFMVNHLARGNSNLRHEQSDKLRFWASTMNSVPIIMVGDYNYDWEVVNGDQFHDEGYDNLTDGGLVTWVRPQDLIRTQFGSDYNSVLDFVFVSGPAQEWEADSHILVFPGDEPDTADKSDHRPVQATFEFEEQGVVPPINGGPNLKQQILAEIAAIELRLKALRELVEAME